MNSLILMRRRLFFAAIKSRAALSTTITSKGLFSTDAVTTDGTMLSLSIKSENHRYDFPLTWLRDNCQCPKCYHPVSKARLSLLRDIPKDLTKTEASIDEKFVRVKWQDGHLSQYSTEWLLERAFDKDKAEGRLKSYQRNVKLWRASDSNVMPRHSLQDIMNSDSSLLNWLQDLNETGLTLLQGLKQGDAKAGAAGILSRIGPARVTHYGTTFQVIDKGDPNNPAYTSSELALHTDLPYYEYIPGAQFLHCVVQHKRKGGENQFADGFMVAKILKEEHPDEFKLLCQTPVEWQDEGVEENNFSFKKLSHLPTFQTDSSGQINRINYSHQQRSSFQPSAASKSGAEGVGKLYDALRLFDRVAHSDKVQVSYKMEEGECVAFDNRRVMHARSSYAGGQGRHLVGWYVDWDEIWSRINVLKSSLE